MSLVVLRRTQQFPHDGGVTPSSWGLPIFRRKGSSGHSIYADDLAIICCTRGHQTRMTSKIHGVDGAGRVTPSYICTIPGCDFHEYIQLEGWDPALIPF